LDTYDGAGRYQRQWHNEHPHDSGGGRWFSEPPGFAHIQVVVKIPFLLGGFTAAPNGDIQFSVGTIVGKTYRIEYTDDLGSNNWLPLGANQMATSSSLTVMDHVNANQTQRFYRVVQLN